eukprot:3670800-Prymnesium_polylepis.1
MSALYCVELYAGRATAVRDTRQPHAVRDRGSHTRRHTRSAEISSGCSETNVAPPLRQIRQNQVIPCPPPSNPSSWGRGLPPPVKPVKVPVKTSADTRVPYPHLCYPLFYASRAAGWQRAQLG